MIFLTVNKFPAFLLEKLHTLFELLKERKTEYECFAGKVNNNQLKVTVLSLAQETNQYAAELSSQIQMMGGKVQGVAHDFHSVDNTMITGEVEILKSCEISEKKMIVAYRSILNEPFLHENLRNLIRYQLNGLTYAFMQLRLLNTSLSLRS